MSPFDSAELGLIPGETLCLVSVQKSHSVGRRKNQKNLSGVSARSILTIVRDEVRVYMKRLSVATFLPVILGSFDFLKLFNSDRSQRILEGATIHTFSHTYQLATL